VTSVDMTEILEEREGEKGYVESARILEKRRRGRGRDLQEDGRKEVRHCVRLPNFSKDRPQRREGLGGGLEILDGEEEREHVKERENESTASDGDHLRGGKEDQSRVKSLRRIRRCRDQLTVNGTSRLGFFISSPR